MDTEITNDAKQAVTRIKDEPDTNFGNSQQLRDFYESSIFSKLGLQRSTTSASESERLSKDGVLGPLTIDNRTNIKPTPRQEIPRPVPKKEPERSTDDPVTKKAIEQTRPKDNPPRNPRELNRLLDTPSGKDLPPVAEIFEKNALAELGPDQKPNVFVSKDRSDRNIPQGATVYSSINEAVQKSKPGSVIQVMPGVYRESVNFGASNSNLVLQTDRLNPAVIDGGSVNIRSGAHEISIKNLEVRNFSGQEAGIRVDGSNIRKITIAGTNVHSASGSEGIAVYGRPGTPVSDIKVIGNRIHDLVLEQLEAMPINGNVDGFKIQGNSGFNLNNLFIDVIGGEGNGGNQDQPRNGVIAYNFGDGISSRRNDAYRRQPSAAGIYSDGGRDLEIYGNYIRNSDFGIELASEHSELSSSRINVYDNIFENSHLAWLTLGNIGGVNSTNVTNNLIIGNSEVERGSGVRSVRVEGNPTAASRFSGQLPRKIVEQLMK